LHSTDKVYMKFIKYRENLYKGSLILFVILLVVSEVAPLAYGLKARKLILVLNMTITLMNTTLWIILFYMIPPRYIHKVYKSAVKEVTGVDPEEDRGAEREIEWIKRVKVRIRGREFTLLPKFIVIIPFASYIIIVAKVLIVRWFKDFYSLYHNIFGVPETLARIAVSALYPLTFCTWFLATLYIIDSLRVALIAVGGLLDDLLAKAKQHIIDKGEYYLNLEHFYTPIVEIIRRIYIVTIAAIMNATLAGLSGLILMGLLLGLYNFFYKFLYGKSVISMIPEFLEKFSHYIIDGVKFAIIVSLPALLLTYLGALFAKRRIDTKLHRVKDEMKSALESKMNQLLKDGKYLEYLIVKNVYDNILTVRVELYLVRSKGILASLAYYVIYVAYYIVNIVKLYSPK